MKKFLSILIVLAFLVCLYFLISKNSNQVSNVLNETQNSLQNKVWNFKEWSFADGGEGSQKDLNGTIKFNSDLTFELDMCENIVTGKYYFSQDQRQIKISSVNNKPSCQDEAQFINDLENYSLNVEINGNNLNLLHPSGIAVYKLFVE